ncbi:3-dehydroquinate synthase, partial [Candidatus Peregrinibacteria bacterium]|nr:3-dehydroquinate synthase [Candidatus Peregrinibacteria bacterium]
KAVFVDINLLKTLPENQIRNGLAEIIKYGVIKDEKFFTYLEKNLAKIFTHDEKVLNYVIEKSIAIKIAVVEKDEREAKNRMILNYGHTYGHALEKLSNYTLLHGYAISIGMVIVNEMATEKGLLKKSDADRIKALFVKAELPVYTMHKPTIKDLMTDKKSDGKSINFILPTKIGQVIIYNQKI